MKGTIKLQKKKICTKLCTRASIVVEQLEYVDTHFMKLKLETKTNESQSATERWHPRRQIHLIGHIRVPVLNPRIREPPPDFH